MWSMERKPHTLDFYIRRIFRIYPLALLAGFATVAFHAPVAGTPTVYFHYQPSAGLGSLVTGLLLFPNLYGDYTPMSVMWSLPYEVEMYLALPLLFFFIRHNFSIWPLLLYWAFTVAICRPLFHGQAHNFFLCIPYFLPGVMAYVGFGRGKPFLPAWLLPLALIFCWSIFMARPGWRQADFLCLAVGLGLPAFHQITAAWLCTASHYIARYSYGMYLAHPFAIVLGLYCMPHQPLAIQLGVMLGATAILSVGAYHLLEHPLIQVGSWIAGRAERRYEQQRLKSYRVAAKDIC